MRISPRRASFRPAPPVPGEPGFVEERHRERVFAQDLRLLHDTLRGTSFADRYWIWGGLLIGWARERRPLAHDCLDADFGFSVADSAHFAEGARALMAAGFAPHYRFRSNDGRVAEYSFLRHGAKFEFFATVPVDGRLRYHLFSIALHPGDTPIQANAYVDDQPTTRCRLVGRRWRRHRDYDAELTRQYGDWRTPDPDWRYTDERAIVDREPWAYPAFDWDGSLDDEMPG